MITIITQLLLLLLVILQLVISIHMLINTYKQYKNDKKFYEKLSKNLEEQQAVFLETMRGEECEYFEQTGDKK